MNSYAIQLRNFYQLSFPEFDVMSSKNFNSFKDFQSDQIQASSRKLFTAHSNSDLNLTLVMGTTNGFIFQIIISLIESWGVRLTCFDCN